MTSLGTETASAPPAWPVRPRVHLTPREAWCNDPNGLVHLDGEWHCYYQHHPASDVWGPMHWGHAVSRDLVRWDPLPVALAPDEHGAIFSGSAYLDRAGLSGHGPDALLAFFTHHRDDGREAQSLAVSHDRGRTFVKHPGNPLLVDPSAGPDHRDPAVRTVTHADGSSEHLLLLAAGREVQVYRSDDLLSWAPTSALRLAVDERLGTVETPDLLSLPLDGGPTRRAVLTASHLTGGPTGGSGTRVLVGAVRDGAFVPDHPVTEVVWADHGADLYALQSFAEAPDGRAVWLGWVNSWAYADAIPSAGWRGAFSIPREVALVTEPDGTVRCTQQPVRELGTARRPLVALDDVDAAAASAALAEVCGLHLDVEVVVEVGEALDAAELVLALGVGDGERTEVRWSFDRGELAVDRRRSSSQPMPDGFAGVHTAPCSPRDGVLDLRVLLDGVTLEVFADGGRVSLTDLVFPAPTSRRMELEVPSGVHVRRLAVAELVA